VLSTETAVDTNKSEIVAAYCAQRDSSSVVSLTVLGTAPRVGDGASDTLHVGTFPLVDNAYCAVEDVAGTPPLVAYFEPSFKNLWSFCPSTSEVSRHHVLDSGPCPANQSAAAIPYGSETPAMISTVGLSLLTLSEMAVFDGGQLLRASTSPPAEALRFPNGGTQSWNVSGSADAIMISADAPVTILGVRLFGDKAEMYAPAPSLFLSGWAWL
jgi:hypothetical protein